MSLANFDWLPDDARVWCFGAQRALDGARTAQLLDSTNRFLERWTAHRRELTAGFALRYQRFLFVAVDESRAGASGCSIDALLHYLTRLETEIGVRLTDSAPVWYRDAEGRIRCVGRAEFRRLAERGEVSGETIVFDLTLTRLGDVRAGRWEVPAAGAWHARLLPDRPGAETRSAPVAGRG